MSDETRTSAAIMRRDYPAVWAKRGHASDCDGSIYRLRDTINVDSLGRQGKGGIVAHVYQCNRGWAGCKALVYVPERTMRSVAAEAIAEPDQDGSPMDGDTRTSGAITCTDCRKGHYAMPGGKVSNFPCPLAALGLCDCWFCQEPTTPAQARARDENGSDTGADR